MKELPVYIGILAKFVMNKTWLVWELGSGCLGLLFWLLPQKMQVLVYIPWLIDNGKWIGLGIFLAVTILVAPFLAWRDEHKAKLQAEKERDELKNEDVELERQKTKLEVEKLKSEQLVIGENGYPRAY